MQLTNNYRLSYIQDQSHKSLPFHLSSVGLVERDPFSLTSHLSRACAQSPINPSSLRWPRGHILFSAYCTFLFASVGGVTFWKENDFQKLSKNLVTFHHSGAGDPAGLPLLFLVALDCHSQSAGRAGCVTGFIQPSLPFPGRGWDAPGPSLTQEQDSRVLLGRESSRILMEGKLAPGIQRQK